MELAAWLDLEDKPIWDPNQRFVNLDYSLRLWSMYRSVEWKHLPYGLPLEEQPDWLWHDFKLISARLSYLRATEKRRKQKRGSDE